VDCNFDDLQKVDCTANRTEGALLEVQHEQHVEVAIDKGLCIAKLEKACNASDECVGFNWPGQILKKRCSSMVKVPSTDSTYFKVCCDFFMFCSSAVAIVLIASLLLIPIQASKTGLPGYACVGGGGKLQTTGSSLSTCMLVPSGKHATADCDGECGAPPPLADSLAALAYRWQHTRWDPVTLPATAVGDAAAISKALLAKYPQ
jgi:hypothetical protein